MESKGGNNNSLL
uniref:Uncharacterized protein n=1 Tax=Rhizophora mucronata TaxID=61149 RepID=A0A2P2KZ69_RHIMU